MKMFIYNHLVATFMDNSKPNILIVDWKTTLYGDPKDNPCYRKFYQQLEQYFECLCFFKASDIPQDVLEQRIQPILLHPGGEREEFRLLRRFSDIPKFLISSHPQMYQENYSGLELKNVDYIEYDPSVIRISLLGAFGLQ